MASQASNFPVKSRAFEVEIDGKVTDVHVSCYADRLMIVASQLGTFGSIMSARRDQVMGGGSTYHIETLLGPRESALHELCARQLAESATAAGCSLPLLICLSLRLSQEAVRQLVSALGDHQVWSH